MQSVALGGSVDTAAIISNGYSTHKPSREFALFSQPLKEFTEKIMIIRAREG